MDDLDGQLSTLAHQLREEVPVSQMELHQRARRVHRRRRVVTASAASLAAVALVTVMLTVRDHHGTSQVQTVSPPPSASHPGTRTVLGVDNGYDRLVLNDLDTGKAKTVTVPGKGAGDFPYQLLPVDGWIVYPGDGISSIRSDLSGDPIQLGRASEFVPSGRSGWVWLVTLSGAVPLTETVQEVRVDGTDRGVVHELPAGRFAQVGIPGGLLVGDGTSWSRWDEATETIGPPLFSGDNGLVDVHDDVVAWALGCGIASTCDSLRVLNLTTGAARDIAAPANTTGWIPTGSEGSRDAFSNDGRYLALRAGGTVPSGANHPNDSQLYVIDLHSDLVGPVANSISDYAFSRVAWSPDGRWVFYETPSHTIGGYQPSDNTMVSYPGACCGVALVTLPK